MTNQVGIWIDHRQAVVVRLVGAEETVKRITSDVDRHVRFAGAAAQTTAEDMRDRRFANQLADYYDAVVLVVRDADEILILGPGEAKGEFSNRLETHHLRDRVIGVEPADKMTDRQIAAQVRQVFRRHVTPADSHGA